MDYKRTRVKQKGGAKMNKRHIVNIRTSREQYIEAKEYYVVNSSNKMRDEWVDLVKLKKKNKESFHVKVQRNRNQTGSTYSPSLTKKAVEYLINIAKKESLEKFIKHAYLIYLDDINFKFEIYSNKEVV
jgi:hypothetical protein